jgi:hypothetical protein
MTCAYVALLKMSEFTAIDDSAFALERHQFALQSDSVFNHIIVRDIESS